MGRTFKKQREEEQPRKLKMEAGRKNSNKKSKKMDYYEDEYSE